MTPHEKPKRWWLAALLLIPAGFGLWLGSLLRTGDAERELSLRVRVAREGAYGAEWIVPVDASGVFALDSLPVGVPLVAEVVSGGHRATASCGRDGSFRVGPLPQGRCAVFARGGRAGERRTSAIVEVESGRAGLVLELVTPVPDSPPANAAAEPGRGGF